MREIIVVTIAFVLMFGFFPMRVSAASEYDGERAAWLASNRAYDECDDWLKVDADCTNYISYCLLAGGLVQHKPIDKLISYRANNKTDYWFAWKRNRSWSWSTSWTVVTDMRGYLNKETWADSNSQATVYKYIIQDSPTGDNNLNAVLKTLKKGDVVQYDENGFHHTVMITVTGKDMKSVCYSGHNRARKDEKMKTFIARAKDKCGVPGMSGFYSIYIIKMGR